MKTKNKSKRVNKSVAWPLYRAKTKMNLTIGKDGRRLWIGTVDRAGRIEVHNITAKNMRRLANALLYFADMD